MNSFLNIAAYKFVSLDRLPEMRDAVRKQCVAYELKGTVLLTPEGINLFLAGQPEGVREWLTWLRQYPQLADLEVKESFSDHQPFSRTLVKIKREIIAFGVKGIEPARRTSPKLPAAKLKEWLDEGRPVTLLDVRNDYEIEVGTFDRALPVGVDHFRQFPDAVKALPVELKNQPIVMFCTGGIRCEKAGPYMEQEGFQQVFQLDGGILKYFETCGGSHYHGDCFVFDHRVAVKPTLEEAESKQCFACQAVLSPDDQLSPYYVFGKSCPHCYQPPAEQMKPLLAHRQQEIQALIHPLPGSIPYDNRRPINIPLRYDQATIFECLRGMHPHLSEMEWHKIFADGHVLLNERPVRPDRVVRAGEQFHHLFPATIEPEVDGNFTILWEDEAILAINKPAPLPVHPCGRFNRNTLTAFLRRLYFPQSPNSVHRLDANTTGLIVFSRTRKVASKLQPQFERGVIKKAYLALVQGHPHEDQFDVDAPIAEVSHSARVRVSAPDGLPAKTSFQVLERRSDGTALLKVEPQTGRTNQIRVHLWHVGFPIVGDPVYLPHQQLGTTQTLDVDEPPMCLHSLSLAFIHPLSGDPISLEAPPPAWGPR